MRQQSLNMTPTPLPRVRVGSAGELSPELLHRHRRIIQLLNAAVAEYGPVLSRQRLPQLAKQLGRARSLGLMTPLLPGVVVVPELAHTFAAKAAAAALYRPDATIVGGAAARLTFWPELLPERIDVAARSHLHSDHYRFRECDVPPRFRMAMPVLTRLQAGLGWLCAPELTAVLMADESDSQSIYASLRSRQVTVDSLSGAIDAIPYRRGNAARRRAVLRACTNPWSAGEALAHRVFNSYGLTGWVANLPVRCAGTKYYLDIAFRRHKLAVEIDGRRFHDSTPEQFEAERLRTLRLTRAGWTVVRVTYSMLVNSPGEVVQYLREILAQLERAAG